MALHPFLIVVFFTLIVVLLLGLDAGAAKYELLRDRTRHLIAMPLRAKQCTAANAAFAYNCAFVVDLRAPLGGQFVRIVNETTAPGNAAFVDVCVVHDDRRDGSAARTHLVEAAFCRDSNQLPENLAALTSLFADVDAVVRLHCVPENASLDALTPHVRASLRALACVGYQYNSPLYKERYAPSGALDRVMLIGFNQEAWGRGHISFPMDVLVDLKLEPAHTGVPVVHARSMNNFAFRADVSIYDVLERRPTAHDVERVPPHSMRQCVFCYNNCYRHMHSWVRSAFFVALGADVGACDAACTCMRNDSARPGLVGWHPVLSVHDSTAHFLRGAHGTRFSVAMDNTRRKGYVTEKIWAAFVANVVPVYWGAPDMLELGFNPDAFVYCNFSLPPLGNATAMHAEFSRGVGTNRCIEEAKIEGRRLQHREKAAALLQACDDEAHAIVYDAAVPLVRAAAHRCLAQLRDVWSDSARYEAMRRAPPIRPSHKHLFSWKAHGQRLRHAIVSVERGRRKMQPLAFLFDDWDSRKLLVQT